jgi:hypothetical protein
LALGRLHPLHSVCQVERHPAPSAEQEEVQGDAEAVNQKGGDWHGERPPATLKAGPVGALDPKRICHLRGLEAYGFPQEHEPVANPLGSQLFQKMFLNHLYEPR